MSAQQKLFAFLCVSAAANLAFSVFVSPSMTVAMAEEAAQPRPSPGAKEITPKDPELPLPPSEYPQDISPSLRSRPIYWTLPRSNCPTPVSIKLAVFVTRLRSIHR